MITGWQNYKPNKLRPLVLYGAGISGSHFLEKNKLKPVFIIDKNAKEIENINKIPLKTLEESSKYLRETEADIIISTIKPEFINEILNFFKQLSLHPKSTIYIYHNYDLKTKTVVATGLEARVSINGAYTYDEYETYFPQINYIKKISQATLQKHFPNIKNAKNIDEIFDILELALWEIKWNKREEQLQLAKQAYLAYINPILSKNQKLADKYQCRIKTLNDYFYYILRGDFSKAKASNKILKAGANFKISVIVPIFNNEATLKRTFNSIIAQSYEHSKIEVIFVDNNSTDNSVKEIKKLINSYKGKISFKLLILKGKDTWHARNIGVEKAKGKYVIFLDAGNQFTKNALLVLSNLAKVYKADIVQGEFPDMKKTIFPEYTSNSFWLYVHFMPMQMGSKLIRKDFIQVYNYWWEKQLDMEAFEWCKNIIVLDCLFRNLFKTSIAFSKRKCEISNVKTKELYPLCNTIEQAEFYLKICRNLLCFAGCNVTLYFFKYKLLQILPLAEQILDKALRIINDNGMKTKELKIEQILRDAIEYFNQCKYITRDIYFKTRERFLKNILAIQNKDIFGEFKNAFAGKTIVLVAGGPTVADFVPIKDAIYIGVNGVAAGASKLKNFEHIKFDFMFIAHRSVLTECKQTTTMLHKKSVVFCSQYGSFQDSFPAVKFRGIDTREYFYFIDGPVQLQDEKDFANGFKRFRFDLTKAPPFVIHSIVNPAFHFSLFSGAKKIYLVGCDSIVNYASSNKTHFYRRNNMMKRFDSTLKSLKHIGNLYLSWKFFKEIAKKYCPDTEIISVNPVGLKGLFHKDVYTR